MATYAWLVGLVIAGCAIMFVLFRVGIGLGKRSADRVWDEGTKKAGAEFSSIWDSQKQNFQATVRLLETEMNNQMLDAVRKTKTAGDPILNNLQQVLQDIKRDSADQPLGQTSSHTTGDDEANSLPPPIKFNRK